MTEQICLNLEAFIILNGKPPESETKDIYLLTLLLRGLAVTGKSCGLWYSTTTTKVQIPTLPPRTCVTVGNLLNISLLSFPFCKWGNDNNYNLKAACYEVLTG